MKVKLTLTLDPDVIKRAKAYARSKGRSLSELIESYLRDMVEFNEGIMAQETAVAYEVSLPAALEELFGSIKIPIDFNEKEFLRNEKLNDYLNEDDD